jgi:hypothetical protein
VTAVVARPAGTGTAVRGDLRRASRWLAVLVLPIGPAAVAILRYVLPYGNLDNSASVAAKVVADPGTQSLVVWLGFVGTLTLVPAVLWVARLTRRRAPLLTAAATLLLVPAYLVLAWIAASDLLLWVGARNGLDATTLATLYDHGHPASTIAEVIFVIGHVVGTVLLGVAMWRSRTVPRWAAVVTVVAQPLHFVAAVVVPNHTLDLVAWGLNAVGFAAVALAVARMSDDDWDLPPIR